MKFSPLIRCCSLAVLSLLLFGVSGLASLDSYDAAIAADHGGGAGNLPHVAALTEAVTLDGSDSAAFDFGEIDGDATFEFILEGDPDASGDSAYLAVGENAGNNLRYEQWRDTSQLGFTRLGNADNQFVAEGDEALIMSPAEATHLAYVWKEADARMELYVDGELAGANDGAAFAMPTGEGFLGNNAGNSEGMAGTIHRVTIYGLALAPEKLKQHAQAWQFSDDPALSVSGGTGLVLDGGDQTFTVPVLNLGENEDLIVDEIEITGANAANFAVTTALPFTIAPGGSMDLAFTFTPNGLTGAVASVFVFTSNDARGTIEVPIGGLIHDPKAEVSVSTLDFGTVSDAASIAFDITNAGNTQDLTINALRLSGSGAAAFAVSDGETIPPGQTRSVTVSFDSGGVAGAFSADLEIVSDDAANPVIVIPLKAIVPISEIALSSYDAVIDGDNAVFAYEAILREPAILDGTNSVEFDFGDVSDSATIEFILEGDPEAGGLNGYLAVGENAGDNLRYEQWRETGQMGFTRLGVADYLFEPVDDPEAVLSPETATHVAYRWDADEATMELYINGVLAGVNEEAGEFGLPTGVGVLGNNTAGSEGMLGTIHRVVVYNDSLPAEVIQQHALAFIEPSASDFNVTAITRLADGQVELQWRSSPGRFYAVEAAPDLSSSWRRVSVEVAAEPDPSISTSARIQGSNELAMEFYRVVQVPPPPLLASGFENGMEAWTVSGNGSLWEFGTPTNGPGAARMGTSVAATSLSDDYADGTVAHLRTPVIDPSNVAGTLRLVFWHYLDANGREGGQISLLEANGTLIQNLEPPFIGGVEGNTSEWSEVNLRLPQLDPVRPFLVQFSFLSEDDGNPLNNGAGWYLDDVRIE